MLIWRLSKREDQALIPISTILKFSALGIVMKTSFETQVSRLGVIGSFVDINIFVMKYYFILFHHILLFLNLLNQNLHKCSDPKKETREFCSKILF